MQMRSLSVLAEHLPFQSQTRLFLEGSRGNTVKITFKNIATADYSKGEQRWSTCCLPSPATCRMSSNTV